MSPGAKSDEELWRELSAASGCSLQEVRNMQSQERRDMIQVCLTNQSVGKRDDGSKDKDDGSDQGAAKRFRAGSAEVEESKRVASWLGEGTTGRDSVMPTEANEIPKKCKEETKVRRLLGLLGVDRQLLAVHRERGREAEDERQAPVFRSRKGETTRRSTSPINHDAFRASLGDIKSRGLFHSGKASAAQWQRLATRRDGCSASRPSFARTQEEEDMALSRKLEEEEEGRVRPATRQQTVKDWGPGKVLGSSGPSESDSIPTSSFFGLARSYKPRSRQIKESD